MEKDEIIIRNIIDAAKKLMQRYGLQKTTMEDIAKEAGKGKSTLYYYFKNKEEIFDRVINLEMDEFFHTVKAAVDRQPGAEDKLKAYIITKIKTLREKINLYRFAFENDLQGRINKEFASLRSRYDNEEVKLIRSILTSGIDTRLFREDISPEIDMLSELFVTCIRGAEIDVITQNKYLTLPDKAEFLVGILTRGIGVRP